MKTNIITTALAAFALTACQQYEIHEVESRLFTFHVKGSFQTNYEDMSDTRAAVRLEEDNTAGITDLWVLDYVDGQLKGQVHQTPQDEDFGHPSLSLSLGQEHLVQFVASKGEQPTLTTTALTWTKVKDTFTLSYPVTVTSTSNVNRAPELHRAVSGVEVRLTDAIATGTATITVGYDRSQSIALPSLAVATAAFRTQSFTIPSSWINDGPKAFITYTLCADDYQTDVDITAKDADGKVIASVTVPSVELRTNRMTVLTGSLFSNDKDFHVSLLADWDTPLEKEW